MKAMPTHFTNSPPSPYVPENGILSTILLKQFQAQKGTFLLRSRLRLTSTPLFTLVEFCPWWEFLPMNNGMNSPYLEGAKHAQSPLCLVFQHRLCFTVQLTCGSNKLFHLSLIYFWKLHAGRNSVHTAVQQSGHYALSRSPGSVLHGSVGRRTMQPRSVHEATDTSEINTTMNRL
jgi:hypothetical protein